MTMLHWVHPEWNRLTCTTSTRNTSRTQNYGASHKVFLEFGNTSFPFQTQHNTELATPQVLLFLQCLAVKSPGFGVTQPPLGPLLAPTQLQVCPLLIFSITKLLHEEIPAQFIRRTSQRHRGKGPHPARPPLTARLEMGLINLGELENRSWEREGTFSHWTTWKQIQFSVPTSD